MKLRGQAKTDFLNRMKLGKKKAQNKRKPAAKQLKSKRKPATTRRKPAALKTTKRKPSMAKRRRSAPRRSTTIVRSVSRGRSKVGGFLNKGIVGKVTSSLGAGMLVGLVTDRIAPAATPFATLGAEYLTGGITGLVAAEGLKSITGQPSILSNFIGGFGLGSTSGPTGGSL